MEKYIVEKIQIGKQNRDSGGKCIEVVEKNIDSG